jgi:hypothetical protein
MAFDDPNYTKAKMGSGIGSLLQGYAGTSQNRQKLQLANKELSMKDPNRQPGLMDLLGIYGDILKTKSVYSSMFPGAMPQSSPQDDITGLLQGIRALQNALEGQAPVPGAPVAPIPATAPAPAGAAGAPAPSSRFSQYFGGPAAPAAGGQPSNGMTQLPAKSYKSLWTR